MNFITPEHYKNSPIGCQFVNNQVDIEKSYHDIIEKAYHGGEGLVLTHIVNKNGQHQVVWKKQDSTHPDEKEHLKPVQAGDKVNYKGEEHTLRGVNKDGYLQLTDKEGRKHDKSPLKVEFHSPSGLGKVEKESSYGKTSSGKEITGDGEHHKDFNYQDHQDAVTKFIELAKEKDKQYINSGKTDKEAQNEAEKLRELGRSHAEWKQYKKEYGNPVEKYSSSEDKKNTLLKELEPLLELKKKLYSNVDIESPMSADEKELNKKIAQKYSEINAVVREQRLEKQNKESKEVKVEHPNREAWRKRISEMDASKRHSDKSELKVGDYVGIPATGKRGNYSGFVKKIGPKNITIETQTGGSGGRDTELSELTFSKDEIGEYYRKKGEEPKQEITSVDHKKVGDEYWKQYKATYERFKKLKDQTGHTAETSKLYEEAENYKKLASKNYKLAESSKDLSEVYSDNQKRIQLSREQKIAEGKMKIEANRPATEEKKRLEDLATEEKKKQDAENRKISEEERKKKDKEILDKWEAEKPKREEDKKRYELAKNTKGTPEYEAYQRYLKSSEDMAKYYSKHKTDF